MQVRVCDRCGAAVLKPLDLASTTRSFVVPQGDPATKPEQVFADFGVDLGVQVMQDLCPPCFASALLEYAIARIVPGTLTPRQVVTILTRIQTSVIAPASPGAVA